MSEDRTLTYVGMDVHQDTIAVAVLRPDGRIDEDTLQATPLAVRRFFARFPERTALRTCYEAGPTGSELQRQLSVLGVECARRDRARAHATTRRAAHQDRPPRRALARRAAPRRAAHRAHRLSRCWCRSSA